MDDRSPEGRRPNPCSTVLAALLAVAVLLPLLGHKPLSDWDEGIYAEVAREMLKRGWMVPHWNGQLWFEKPPLALWITASLFRVFGVSEFTARLGSALAGAGLVTSLHFWLERRVSRTSAWLNTSILLATFGFLHIARAGEMDTLLSLGCALSMIGLVEADRSTPWAWYLFWTGAAIAVMTKGAASLVIFITAALFALVQRWRVSRVHLPFWAGLLLFLGLVAPWHVAMYLRFGHAFLAEYLGLHVWSRATEQIEGHNTHWWFYLKVILVSAPPFSLLYGPAAVRSIRTGTLRAFSLFGIVVIVFYSVVQTRLPHYIAPAYPAFSAVTAVMLADIVRAWRTRHSFPLFWPKVAAGAAVVYALAAIMTAHTRSGLHSAVLPDGRVLPDNKEAVALLRRMDHFDGNIGGPVLVLRSVPAPINAVVFYSRRNVQQVELLALNENTPRDRYTDDALPLAEAVKPAPSLIVLDKDLQSALPAQFAFHPIQQGRTVELGTIQRESKPDSTRAHP